VAMTSVDVTHVCNYSVADIMPVSNAELYVVPATSECDRKLSRVCVLSTEHYGRS
jgi:hypothetical protein